MIRLYRILSIWISVISLSVLGLYQLASEIKKLESLALDLEVAIAHENEAIGVLEAEWSHLDDPKRIAYLSQHLLGLEPVDQLSSLSKTHMEWFNSKTRSSHIKSELNP